MGQLDCSGETLVTHRVIVFESDLQLDSLEEVSLLLVVGVVQQLLYIATHSGCSIPRGSVSIGIV